VAVAYGFLLPAIAVLHVRHAAVRQSGAILATIAGAAVATVGLAGSANVDVRPASLFVLGMWWWTIGKMWVQTGVLPRTFGRVTAALGLVAFALVPLVLLTRRRDVMGVHVNHRVTTAVASAVAGLIVVLNVYLLTQTFGL